MFPLHLLLLHTPQLFPKLGAGGFLGATKPKEYGGLGLDYTYSVAIAEELGSIRCGAIGMAIGVQVSVTRWCLKYTIGDVPYFLLSVELSFPFQLLNGDLFNGESYSKGRVVFSILLFLRKLNTLVTLVALRQILLLPWH